MATEAQIRSIVVRVLLSTSALKIDFTLGSIHVDGPGLAGVAGMVAGGGVSMAVRDDLPAGVAAGYRNDYNQIVVSRGFVPTAENRMTLVHECTHALHDLFGAGTTMSQRGSRYTTNSENEATGYIAGALYHLYETGSAASSDDPIFQHAFRIAGAIKNQKGARVPTNDAWLLRNLIAIDPSYRDTGLWEPTKGDGP